MAMHHRGKKDEEEGNNLYTTLDKITVFQEAKKFNDVPINPKACITTLTKILTLLMRGDKLGRHEATETFFSITKLFQNKEPNLRRMVYLLIKEMSTIADDVIIVTSSLTKDMTGSEMAFRAPAIRSLCKILDISMLQSIERYMKQAIVDKSSHIASAALVSAIHFLKDTSQGAPGSTAAATEIVRRWSNEILAAANNGERSMVQYHAVGLLYLIRRVDRLSVIKLIQNFTRGSVRSPMAYSVLIRIAAKQLNDEGINNNVVVMDFLESSLQSKYEMVIYEAARSIVSLDCVTTKQLNAAISCLRAICSYHKAVSRYAAVRTLNAVAMKHPNAVLHCNLDLQQLINDSNRSIAVLAITTLLKTGNENSVERLLKQINTFMNDITDEFKIVVVDSIRLLGKKYPKKYSIMIHFLSNLLRSIGGYKFKKAVVRTIESVILDIPQAKYTGLLNLCEFIEDCEHVSLTQRILYLLGMEGPYLKNPRKFIRYIYNRIILENTAVRCTGVTALARFGAHNPEFITNVTVLLRRIMLDDDDEVRDRATYYYMLLTNSDSSLRNHYVLDKMMYSVSAMEKELQLYIHNSVAHDEPFNINQVTIDVPQDTYEMDKVSLEKNQSGDLAPFGDKALLGKDSTAGEIMATVDPASIKDQYIEQLAKIPKFSNFGPLFKSTDFEPLTEPDTEYVVKVKKHLFFSHVVLQFQCVNTMRDQVLENVEVIVQSDAPSITVESVVPCSQLLCDIPNSCYVSLALPVLEHPDIIETNLSNTLQFVVRECDDSMTISEDVQVISDVYPLEEFSLVLRDHVIGTPCINFASAWNELSADCESEENYVLDRCKSIPDAVVLLMDHIGMYPCERSDHVESAKSSHQLFLNGIYRSGAHVMTRCKMAQVPSQAGVTIQLTVRCEDPVVRQIFLDALC